LIDEHTQPGNRNSGTGKSARGRTGDAKSEMPSFQFTERGLESQHIHISVIKVN
jgi:hypothetical protein